MTDFKFKDNDMYISEMKLLIKHFILYESLWYKIILTLC
jgi:hypothetical protein